MNDDLEKLDEEIKSLEEETKKLKNEAEILASDLTQGLGELEKEAEEGRGE